jgi:glutamine phosphoribosylpyrophosphate amidotransferase
MMNELFCYIHVDDRFASNSRISNEKQTTIEQVHCEEKLNAEESNGQLYFSQPDSLLPDRAVHQYRPQQTKPLH